MNISELLLPYDPVNRNLKTQDLIKLPINGNEFKDLIAFLEVLANKVFRCKNLDFYKEISEWSRYRAVFCLLPEVLLFGDSLVTEEKEVITNHLVKLGVEPVPDLVRGIKCLCFNFRAKKNAIRQIGITDVFFQYNHIFNKLMFDQGDRCCYCGIQLVYGQDATLDHRLPFFLGDDPHDGSNWCLCCQVCNRGKSKYPYYSLSNACLNWIDPSSDGKLSESTRFAAFKRDQKCVICNKPPKIGKLKIRKRIPSGCWILDNVEVICDEGC